MQKRNFIKRFLIYFGLILMMLFAGCGKKVASNVSVIDNQKHIPVYDETVAETKTEAPTTQIETSTTQTEIATEKVTEKATEKVTEKQTEKVTEKATEKVTEKQTEKATEKATEKQTEKVTEAQTVAKLDENGSYTTKDDVALYLYTYGKLPSNFITKKEAQKLGWSSGGLDKYMDGGCIGGDNFGNFEGNLPTKKGRKYYECDIDTLHQKSRGAKRIVFSNDGNIYYTEDHYSTFELLYENAPINLK